MDNPAARFSSSRPNIDDPVGRLHCFLVVFDDDESIAEVAQPFEGVDELTVVALMKADRRLIQNVEDAHKARTDLRGEANPLCFPT